MGGREIGVMVGAREREHVVGDIADLRAVEDTIAAEGQHLRDARVFIGGIDADADGFLDGFGLAAP